MHSAIILAVFLSLAHGQGFDVTLTSNLVEPLGSGYVYEGWLIANGRPYSTGTFSVTPGQSGPLTFANVARDIPAGAVPTRFVVSIEPANDPDPSPAAPKPFGAALSDSGAEYTGRADFRGGTGLDDSTFAGTYFLAVPTDTNNVAQPWNGVWFNPLSLPTLSASSGWQYEGWVVPPNGGAPISTGTFRDGGAADSNGGGPQAGPGPSPPFPGEDFVLAPQRDLRGYTTVISVEPVPDDSPAPFQFKPLASVISGSLTPAQLTNTPIPQSFDVRVSKRRDRCCCVFDAAQNRCLSGFPVDVCRSVGFSCQGDATRSLRVQVVNLSSLSLTPIGLATGPTAASVRYFTLGTPASVPTEELAEGGSTAAWRSMLEGRDPGVRVQQSSQGLLGPGQSQDFTLPYNKYLSIGTMLLPTNAAFTGLNAVDVSNVDAQGTLIFYANSYDAGTEANDELCANIPGPLGCGGGEGFNAARNGVGFVRPHPTTHGTAGVVKATYDWKDPVAIVRVTLQ